MQRYDLFIDGASRPSSSGATWLSENPASEEPWAEVAKATIDDVDAAVASGRRAFVDGTWRNMTREARAEVLERLAELMQDRQDELVFAEVADGGGTFRKACTADIPASAETFQYYAELLRETPEEEVKGYNIPVNSRNIIRREPLGVVACIVPFNFPLAGASWKVAPALAAGNSVILKPSPYTPVTATMFAELAHEAGVPAGVFNVVCSDDHDIGAALVAHRDVAKVAFTGSTAVGSKVMASCADNVRPIILELGGKSPNIILSDAEIDVAVRGALFGTFFHGGQICESGTRLLVDRRIYDDFVGRLAEEAGRIAVGDPMDPMTTMGPLISRAQRDRVERYVGLGHADGARLVRGGQRPGGLERGYYYEPTIFASVANDMAIARDEIFGPVVSVIPFEDESQALQIANDTMYGLGAAVWSRDVDRALAMARHIEAGTVWINDYHLLNPRFEFGGFKRSGFGRELGPSGLQAFQQIKHIHVGEPGTVEDKYYFGLLLGEDE